MIGLSLICSLMLNTSTIDSTCLLLRKEVKTPQHELNLNYKYHAQKTKILTVNSSKLKFTFLGGVNKTAFVTLANEVLFDEDTEAQFTPLSFVKFDARVKYRFTSELSTAFRTLSIGDTRMYFFIFTFKNKHTGKSSHIRLI